jgi:hypothetical protein
MTKHLTAILLISLAMSSPYIDLHAAQKNKPIPSAPIPAPILSAVRVFIANGGGDESLFDPQYTGGPDRLYDEFYSAMKAWGRYDLVDSPGDADLAFEIRLTIFQPQRSEPLSSDKPPYDSQFHLSIRDLRTHETLWGLTEHAQTAVLQSNRDKNFEQALSAIIVELKRIAGPKPPAPNN